MNVLSEFLCEVVNTEKFAAPRSDCFRKSGWSTRAENGVLVIMRRELTKLIIEG